MAIAARWHCPVNSPDAGRSGNSVNAFFILLALAVVSVVLLRRSLLHRPVPAPASEPFEGVVYSIGSATVAERSARDPRATVLCVPGYCENARYFTGHYADPRIQLILMGSADYHTGLACDQRCDAPWAKAPDAPEGSIEYDALVLIQALEQLPKSDHIRVHGHSRGGAVILEAASLQPDLFQGVEVVLETPVLPQASLIKPLPVMFYWLMPLLAPLWRRWPISPLMPGRWGALHDERKRELIASMPFNARHTRTLVANLKSIERWIHERKSDLYRNLESGIILIADNDQVLDAAAMLSSARSAGARWQVKRVALASHFLLLDQPQAMPPLYPLLAEAGQDDSLPSRSGM